MNKPVHSHWKTHQLFWFIGGVGPFCSSCREHSCPLWVWSCPDMLVGRQLSHLLPLQNCWPKQNCYCLLTLIRWKCLVNRAVASCLTLADWNKKEDLMQNCSQTGWAKRNRCVFRLNFKEQKDAAHISGPRGSSAAPESQRSSSQDAAQQGDSVHSCWQVTEKSSSIMHSEPGAFWQDLQHWNILHHVFRVVSPVFSKLWNTWE